MKWTYISKGHYSTSDGKGGTVHVVGSSVYVTHPKRTTVDVTGDKADMYITSATGKTPTPSARETSVKTPMKKKQKAGKLAAAIKKAKAIGKAAKPVVSAAVKAGEAVASVGGVVVEDTGRKSRRASTEHPMAYLTGSASTAPDISYLTGCAPSPRGGRGKTRAAKRRREQTIEEFTGF